MFDKFKYTRLSKNDAACLLVDHQSGLISLVQDFSPGEFKNNVLALHCTNTAGNAWLDAGFATQSVEKGVQPAKQLSVSVTATRTTYLMQCGPVKLELGFLSPLLLNDLSQMASPVSYVTIKASASDQREDRQTPP